MLEKSGNRPPAAGGPLAPGGNYRWAICALLFAATTINYIDRQVIGILKPELQGSLGWSQTDFAAIVFWFQVAYAAGFLFSGRLADRIGCRVGLALAVAAWSLAEIGHAMVRTVAGFAFARFALGLAEGGNFPASIKSVSDWFPKKERALATGLFNSGSNVGGLVAPLLVPWISLHYGWPAAFVVTGGLGFIWLVFWMLFYDHPQRHPRLGEAERAYITSDPPDPPVQVPWLRLLAHRQTWAFCTGMFMTAPVFWFYLYWTPGFLHERYGLNMEHLGLPLVVISLMTCLGSIGGGWISSALMKRGWGVNAAQDRLAGLRLVGGARLRHALRPAVAGHRSGGAGFGGPPGLCRQPLHHGQRHRAPSGGQFGGRHRRAHGWDRRHALGQNHRRRVGHDRQL